MLASCVAGFAQEAVKLKFATLSPSEGPLNARALHPWAERVNAAGKGIVELDVRDGYAIANYDNVYTRVLDDVVQIAFTVTGAISASSFGPTSSPCRSCSTAPTRRRSRSGGFIKPAD